MSFMFGDQKVWYRDLPDIEEQMRELNIPDDEELWNWGYCRRSSGDYDAHVAGGFTDLISYLNAEAIEVDALLVCGPIQNSTECFVGALQAGLLPSISINPDQLRRVDHGECINVMQALAEARDLIRAGRKYALILAAEKLKEESSRFRKYSMISDFCFALLVTSEIERCDCEILDVYVRPDQNPCEDTSKILMRNLETDCVTSILTANSITSRDISKFFYLNLFMPIAEMKAKHAGFGGPQIYTEATRDLAHCYGADPFINLHAHSASGSPGETYVLCASAREYAAVSLVTRLR
jgi:hypothetical protein